MLGDQIDDSRTNYIPYSKMEWMLMIFNKECLVTAIISLHLLFLGISLLKTGLCFLMMKVNGYSAELFVLDSLTMEKKIL